MARLPTGSAGDGGVPPLEVYKVAVEEYRFQAQFNWSRTQYLLAFNAGIFAAAAALTSLPSRAAVFVFLLGFATAVLSIPAVKVMHGYYRAARDRMRRVEERVHLSPDEYLDTTATLGGRKRRISVNQIVYLLLASLAVANLIGALLVLARR